MSENMLPKEEEEVVVSTEENFDVNAEEGDDSVIIACYVKTVN